MYILKESLPVCLNKDSYFWNLGQGTTNFYRLPDFLAKHCLIPRIQLNHGKARGVF